MTANQLMPCPFCGGTNVYLRGEASGWSVVHTCQIIEGVRIDTFKHRNKHDAINAWNRRCFEVEE